MAFNEYYVIGCLCSYLGSYSIVFQTFHLADLSADLGGIINNKMRPNHNDTSCLRIIAAPSQGGDGFVGAADLGGSIITGINGNPLAVLARQLGVPLQNISSKCLDRFAMAARD